MARPLLATEPDDIRWHVEWLMNDPRLPDAFDGTPRLLYNDLCPEHVLVAPATGRVVGLIDFTDVSWGDPVLDFTVLPGWLGWPATTAALRAAGTDADDAFRERLRCRSRLKTLYWLRHAHLRQGDVAKRRRWVRRAFASGGGA